MRFRPLPVRYAEVSYEELHESIEAPETMDISISQVLYSPIFRQLKVGRERACIVLRVMGLNRKEIGMVLGLSESKIDTTIGNIKRRLRENNQEV
jgi:DNA-directed RNA polymerase specialized sigma subunit